MAGSDAPPANSIARFTSDDIAPPVAGFFSEARSTARSRPCHPASWCGPASASRRNAKAFDGQTRAKPFTILAPAPACARGAAHVCLLPICASRCCTRKNPCQLEAVYTWPEAYLPYGSVRSGVYADRVDGGSSLTIWVHGLNRGNPLCQGLLQPGTRARGDRSRESTSRPTL